MKSNSELIAALIYDMLDAWNIVTKLERAGSFRRRFPFLANDLVYTYRISYCMYLCKLIDPAVQNGHKNMCFESEIISMKSGAAKVRAQDLLEDIRKKSSQYRRLRDKLGAHSCRQVMSSRRAISTPGIEQTNRINSMLGDLFKEIFKCVLSSPPVEVRNDLSAMLSSIVSQRDLRRIRQMNKSRSVRK